MFDQRKIDRQTLLRLLCSILFFAAAGHFPAVADGFVESESYSYSESLNIGAIRNNFRGGDFDASGEKSFTHNQVAVGVSTAYGKADFHLAALARYDYYAGYSPGLAQLIYDAANLQPIEPGTYALNANLKEVEAKGLRLGAGYALTENFSVQIQGSWLQTRRLTEGAATGLVTIVDGADISGGVNIDYSYANDLLFNTAVPHPTGNGVTLDVHADWQLTNRLSLALELDDVWSQINWSDAPRTTANATSATVSVDEDGLLTVRPILQGQNSRSDLKQSYFTRSTLSGEYDLTNGFSVRQTAFNIDDIWLYPTRVFWRVTDTVELSTEAEWKSGAVGIGATWKKLYLKITTDDIDPNKAKYLHANAGFRFQF